MPKTTCRRGLRPARLFTAILRLPLVDRCLLLMLIVLLLQSAYGILVLGEAAGGSRDIDIIVRTSSAAIFGYFLSADLRSRAAGKTGETGANGTAGTDLPPAVLPEGTDAGEGAITARIGFAAPGEDGGSQTSGTPLTPGAAQTADVPQVSDSREGGCSTAKVLVVTGIGLFCLGVLLALRNWPAWNEMVAASPGLTAAAAQFRDFVSGCVGYLIGCPARAADTGS